MSQNIGAGSLSGDSLEIGGWQGAGVEAVTTTTTSTTTTTTTTETGTSTTTTTTSSSTTTTTTTTEPFQHLVFVVAIG